jgi:hypothetical protein
MKTNENTQNELVSFDEFFQKKNKTKSSREFQVVEMTAIAVEAYKRNLPSIIIVDSLPVDESHKQETAKLMTTARGYVQNTLKKLDALDSIVFGVLNLQDLPSSLTQAQRDFLKALYALRHRKTDYVDYYQKHLSEVKNK